VWRAAWNPRSAQSQHALSMQSDDRPHTGSLARRIALMRGAAAAATDPPSSCGKYREGMDVNNAQQIHTAAAWIGGGCAMPSCHPASVEAHSCATRGRSASRRDISDITSASIRGRPLITRLLLSRRTSQVRTALRRMSGSEARAPAASAAHAAAAAGPSASKVPTAMRVPLVPSM
jgi:hypothetical protein